MNGFDCLLSGFVVLAGCIVWLVGFFAFCRSHYRSDVLDRYRPNKRRE